MPVIKEISSYELGPSYHKKKLLYQFVKDCSECCRDSVDMIPSGTFHIGEFIEVSRVAREFETHTMITYGLHFEVYYSKLPSESNFTNVSHKDMHVEPTDDEIRLYDIGDIGQEITKSTSPEQVAQKYFGNSDFSTFFDHETLPLVSKRMALSRADIPRRLQQYPVSVPSRAYTTYNPSRFEKFKQAVYRSGVEALPLAAAGFIPNIRNALGYSTPDAAYYAIAAAPIAYGIDLLDSHRSNEAMRKKLMFTPSDRDQLVNTGAMATELAKRLVDGQTSHERYAILSRVHKKQQEKEKKGVIYPHRGGKITHRKRNKRLKSNTRKYKHK
jgi:hypothetical protein